MASSRWRTGLRGFFVVWTGQFVSTVGTLMTSLALTFWAFDVTGRATELGLMFFFTFGPRLIFMPIAGALLDQWNRKKLLILADALAGLTTILTLTLISLDLLQIWHLYVLTALLSTFGCFQNPGFTASATLMVPKKHYGRTSGLLMLTYSASSVIAPALAGILLPILGLRGILVVDLATFLVAVGTIALIPIPQPKRDSTAPIHPIRQIGRDLAEGFRYLFEHGKLFTFLGIHAVINMLGIFYDVLLRPMVLLRTGDNEIALATILSLFGFGGAAGALAVTLWGGPKKRRIPFSFLVYILAFALRALSGLNIGVIWLAAFAFGFSACLSLGTSAVRAFFQSKVPPALQARVWATFVTLVTAGMQVTMLIAGPLADRVVEPAMQSGGALAKFFGGLVGTGAGAGLGLLVFLGNLGAVIVFAIGYAFRSMRSLDVSLPDHDQTAEETS